MFFLQFTSPSIIQFIKCNVKQAQTNMYQKNKATRQSMNPLTCCSLCLLSSLTVFTLRLARYLLTKLCTFTTLTTVVCFCLLTQCPLQAD